MSQPPPGDVEPSQVLEREEQCGLLRSAAEASMSGSGQVVLVSGPAGAGKTTLVQLALRRLAAPGGTRPVALVGRCDPVATPMALGPLHDIALHLPDDVVARLDADGRRAELFASLHRFLAAHHTVLVIEDVHWADEATLDLVVHLGRRMGSTRSLLVCTFRSDEIVRAHPLRRALGALGPAPVRIDVPPLSFDAVRQLTIGSTLDAASVFARTHGNAFFVSEVLANPEQRVPATVEDAVLARAAGLGPTAWSILDAVALSPHGLPLEVASQEPIGTLADVDAVLACGLVIDDRSRLRCSHDLVRLTLDAQVAGHRRVVTHRRLLDALTEHGVPVGELAAAAAHAIGAGDAEAIVRHSLAAARYAAVQRAHRQAADHYVNALRFVDRIDPERVDEVMHGASYQAYLTNDLDTAVRWAARRCERLLEPLAAGDAHRWLSRVMWFQGRTADAHRAGRRAINLLDPLGPSRELAWACSNMAQLAMLDSRIEETVHWADRALTLAQALGAADVESHAANNLGTGSMEAGRPEGEPMLRRALGVALDHDLGEHAARAYTNLGFQLTWQRRLTEAADVLDTGIEYCETHELDSWVAYMSATRAKVDLLLGDHAAASRRAAELLEAEPPAITRQQALEVLATCRLRAGDDGGLVDEHTRLAEQLGDFVRVLPAVVLELERAWMLGTSADLSRAREVARRAMEHGDAFGAAALVRWLARLEPSCVDVSTEQVSAAVAAELRGDWRRAETEWTTAGCVVEAAMAAALTLDRTKVREALDRLVSLGATATADAVRRDVARLGMESVPRGASSSTRANPAGLTDRQLEVLARLAAGDSNTEIADALVISKKTADHHVSAILAKLGVRTRGQAVARAVERGWL